ncbi:hypothetical protein HRI_002657100 [Hibiscus trionum]|uniref:Integrase catalytic domain-containing protein n=1 Tax=Hibiscus trionum TaxID=183268 RepID=A0A9W7I6K6_HIBTR|nr:hypothetical protein HRI_002657100 [Hibiscus trionum]
MIGNNQVGSSALVTQIVSEKPTRLESFERKSETTRAVNRDSMWCTYCKKPRHTRERCWKLHGKPQSTNKNFIEREGSQSRAHATREVAKESTEQSGEFTQEEVEKLKILLESLGKSSIAGTGNLVFSGISSSSSQNSNALESSIPNQTSWVIDSGATDHMTNSPLNFLNYTPCPSNRKITVADGTMITVAGERDVAISKNILLRKVLHVPKLFTSLISIPKLVRDTNCSVLFHSTHCFFQEQETKKMIGRAKEINGLYYLENLGGQVRILNTPPSSFLSNSTNNKDQIWLHHLRLGHPPFKLLKTMFPSLCKTLDVEELHCDVCELAKHKRSSFPASNNRTNIPFSLIHSDVWGPSSVPNITGARWFVSFIDDHTRVTWIYLLKQKSDVASTFQNFYTMIKTQFGAEIKRIRSDNAKDYFNQILSPFLLEKGILHESSCVNTPQQNGISKRKNGHILAITRALLFQNNVPKKYWGEAVLTATFMMNRLSTKVLGSQSPIQTLTKFFPHLNLSLNLQPRVFGCVAFVHLHSPNRGKLDPRAVKCIFLGYSSTQKGYKCYHPPTRKFYVTADVTFVERESYFTAPYLQGEMSFREDKDADLFLLQQQPLSLIDLPPSHSAKIQPSHSAEIQPSHYAEIQPSPSHSAEIQPSHSAEIQPPSQSLQTEPNSPQTQPNRNISQQNVQETTGPLKTYSRRKIPMQTQSSPAPALAPIPINFEVHSETDPDHNDMNSNSDFEFPIAIRKGKRTCTTKHPSYLFMTYNNLSPNHRTFLTSLNNIVIPKTVAEALDNENWKKAMQEEMDALEKNKTWDLVKLPGDKKTVGCRWVYTVKYKSDGSLERYKARLVAKGYSQTYGIDYLETFAPVAKMNTVRVLLSLAANQGWNLLQFDIKNAFLHGDLEEEVYMDVPPGFNSTVGQVVCKLKKALYGLKQSPRAWFGRFAKVMLGQGFKQSQGDHTLFVKHSSSGGVTILLVYVDDIIVTGNDSKGIINLKKCLIKEFEVKELGRLKYFLGIEVAHSQQGIFISQQKYTLDLLKETGKLGCKPAETPIEVNHKLGDSDEDDMAVDRGSFQRLVGRLIYLSHTRPDIAYAVGVVSQFMHNPKKSHLRAVMRILQYLKGTPGKGIMFRRGGNLTLEAYTDADYAGSRMDRRSTSGYCTFFGGNLVTWRSKKQNVVARSSAEAEFRAMALGICELLWLKIILEDLKVEWNGPMMLYCDNKSAINIAHNPVQHDRTKHVEVDRHFIKEKLDSGLICTPYVTTGNQIADILTKGLLGKDFQKLTSKLRMEDIHAPA